MKIRKNLEAKQAQLEKEFKALEEAEHNLEIEQEQVIFDAFCKSIKSRHIPIAEYLWGELSWNIDTIKDFFEMNKEELHKRFFVNVWWNTDSQQCVCNANELIETIKTKLTASYDEGFDMTILDLKTGKEYEADEIVTIKLKI